MSDSPPSKYDCGTITHTDSNQKVNLEFLDPSTSVTSEKKKVIMVNAVVTLVRMCGTVNQEHKKESFAVPVNQKML